MGIKKLKKPWKPPGLTRKDIQRGRAAAKALTEINDGPLFHYGHSTSKLIKWAAATFVIGLVLGALVMHGLTPAPTRPVIIGPIEDQEKGLDNDTHEINKAVQDPDLDPGLEFNRLFNWIGGAGSSRPGGHFVKPNFPPGGGIHPQQAGPDQPGGPDNGRHGGTDGQPDGRPGDDRPATETSGPGQEGHPVPSR